MEIISTTITARATANYQVGEIAIQISNHTEDELHNIEMYAINEAVSICNELQRQTGTTKPETPAVQTQRTTYPQNQQRYTNQQAQQSYRTAPANTGYQNNGGYTQDTRANRPVSEKQINYIRSLGWTGQMPTNFLEADELLKRLKAERGIN